MKTNVAYRITATHTFPKHQKGTLIYPAAHTMHARAGDAHVRDFIAAARADGCEVEIVEITERHIEELPQS